LVQLFDCDFAGDVVRYIHNGNPHLATDRIRLTRRQFVAPDRRRRRQPEVLSDDVTLSVDISAPPDGAVVAAQRPLAVDTRRSPLSDVIGPASLRFRYDFTAGAVCTLVYSTAGEPRYRRQWLVAGQLVARDGAPVANLSTDCRDFLSAGFRYRYTAGRPRTAVDYIALRVNVDNYTESALTEAVFLPVRLVGAPANKPPTVRRLPSQRQLHADEFVPLVLTGEVISARDDVTAPEDLLVSVLTSRRPARGSRDGGHLVHRRWPWRPLSAFWLRDLLAGSVAFRALPATSVDQLSATDHPGRGRGNPSDHPGRRVELVLRVSDGYWASSDEIRLAISVRTTQLPAGRGPPRIGHNAGLTVLRGGAACVGPETLRLVDNTSGVVTVRVLRGGPRHGTLTVLGRPVESFGWASVERCEVVYQHDVDSLADSDQIQLRLTDANSGSVSSFLIAKFHYTDPTGPDRTKSADFVWSAPFSHPVPAPQIRSHDFWR